VKSLELVDDEEQLTIVGEDPAQHAVEAVLAELELGGKPVGLGDGDAPEALGQLFERGATRQHGRDEPPVGPRHLAPANAWQEPGTNDARLAAPRAAYDEHEPASLVVACEPGQDLVHEFVPSEEVGSVGLLEGTQALVGIG
jgi:hypothetical protein